MAQNGQIDAKTEINGRVEVGLAQFRVNEKEFQWPNIVKNALLKYVSWGSDTRGGSCWAQLVALGDSRSR